MVKTHDKAASLFNASGGSIDVSSVVDIEVYFGDVLLRLGEVLVADVGFNVLSPWCGAELGWKTYLSKTGSRMHKGNKKSIKLVGHNRAWWAFSGGKKSKASSKKGAEGPKDMELDSLKDTFVPGSEVTIPSGPRTAPRSILKKGGKGLRKVDELEDEQCGRHALSSTPFSFLLRGFRFELFSPESPLKKPEVPQSRPESPLRKPEVPQSRPESPLGKPEVPQSCLESPKKSLACFRQNY